MAVSKRLFKNLGGAVSDASDAAFADQAAEDRKRGREKGWGS